MGLPVKHGHEQTQEVGNHFVYRKSLLPAIALQFKTDIRLSSIAYVISGTWKTIADEQPRSFPCGIILPFPPAPVHKDRD